MRFRHALLSNQSFNQVMKAIVKYTTTVLCALGFVLTAALFYQELWTQMMELASLGSVTVPRS